MPLQHCIYLNSTIFNFNDKQILQIDPSPLNHYAATMHTIQNTQCSYIVIFLFTGYPKKVPFKICDSLIDAPNTEHWSKCSPDLFRVAIVRNRVHLGASKILKGTFLGHHLCKPSRNPWICHKSQVVGYLGMKIELSYKKFIDGNHPKLKTCFNLVKSAFRKVQPRRDKIQAQENTNPQKNK